MAISSLAASSNIYLPVGTGDFDGAASFTRNWQTYRSLIIRSGPKNGECLLFLSGCFYRAVHKDAKQTEKKSRCLEGHPGSSNGQICSESRLLADRQEAVCKNK